jgi:hypothetical protein
MVLGHRAGSFPRGVEAGEKAVVIALSMTKPPAPGIEGKARDQDEEGKLPRFEGVRLPDGFRLPDIEKPQGPGAGGGIDPVKDKGVPFNFGDINFFFIGKGRFQ